MSSWASNVRNWFSGNANYGSFNGYGANIVNGLNAGISSNGGSSNSFINNWANSIKSWFMKAFKMHSPSKIFSGFGGFFVEGLNNGIEDNMGDTLSTLKTWGNEITSWADNLEVSPIEIGTKYTDAGTTFQNRESASAVTSSLISKANASVANASVASSPVSNSVLSTDERIIVNITLQGEASGLFRVVRSEAIKYTNATREPAFPV
jgi:hypothetical protein